MLSSTVSRLCVANPGGDRQMHNHPTPVGLSPLADELASLSRAELARALRQDLTSYSGPSIGFGIMIAGGAYPLVIAAVCLVFIVVQIVVGLLFRMYPGAVLMELAIMPFFLAGYAGLGAMLGLIWAGIICTIMLPIVYLFVRSLRLRGSLVWLGAFSGGLIGFIAALPLTLSLPWMFGPADIWALLVQLALGPGLATVLGQVGGAWGGWRAWQNSERFYGITVARAAGSVSPDAAGQRLTDVRDATASRPDPPLQFGLRHMMWLIVWLSLLLSVIRLSGIPFEYVLPVLIGWLLYQWLTLRVGRLLVQRAGPRWMDWRARRST